MKKNIIIVLSVLIVITTSSFVYYKTTSVESIKGCYVAYLARDVYSLTILTQLDNQIEGELRINNFEKDSSFGTIRGTYKNGILTADYTFMSEGVESVGPVIFKKTGDAFLRGYGETNAAGDSFADINKVIFDSSVVYAPTTEGCIVSNQ